MKMNLCVASIVVVGAMASATASADWSGPYVGGTLGVVGAREHIDSDEDGTPRDASMRGYGLGVFYGDNSQKGKWVRGWEVDLSLFSVDGESVVNGESSEYANEIKANGHFRMRFGYEAGKFLPYVGYGLAWANTQMTITDGSAPESFNRMRVGLSLGLGVDFAVSSTMALRAELVHDDYASVSVGDDNGTADSHNLALRTNTVRFGVMFK